MATVKVDVYNKFSGNLATYTFRVEKGTETWVSTFATCGEKALKKFYKENAIAESNKNLYKFRRHIG